MKFYNAAGLLFHFWRTMSFGAWEADMPLTRVAVVKTEPFNSRMLRLWRESPSDLYTERLYQKLLCQPVPL
jgi:hypothetical protein